MKKFVKFLLPVLLLALLTGCPKSEGNPDIGYDFSAPPEVQLFPPEHQVFGEEFDPVYKEFKEIVSNRDYKNFERFLDKNTATSPDPQNPTGLYEFYDAWGFNYFDPATSALWPELDEILRLGGRFDAATKTFMAPYTVFDCPDEFKDNDGDYCFILIDKGVNLYEEKDTESKIIAKLDYNIVYLDRAERGFSDKAGTDLIKINTLGKVEGYIKKQHMKSLLEWRIEITETEDGWKLKYLIFGKELEWIRRSLKRKI